MTLTTTLGLAAGAFTTLASLPQVLKAWKTKHTKDISFWMYLLLDTGVALWTIYGVIIKDAPIIIANVLTFILVSMILAMKLKYG